MEDILASIRRILNEDEVPPTTAAAEAEAPAAPPEDEPLVLTEEMMVVAPEETTPPEAPAQPAPPPAAETLLAPAAAAAAAASVGQLLRAVSTERATAVSRGGPTIEDLVREELRPLLKDWLDQHLPAVVERLVRAEIERVVGRALS
jgi:cell pole-organizing protein PopZ